MECPYLKADKRQPALTPLLLVAENYLESKVRALARSDSLVFSPFVNTIWGTTLVASFAIITVSDWDLRRYAISILPVVALFVGYITLTPRADKSTSLFPSFDIEHATRPLSLRVVGLMLIILGIETIKSDLPRSNIVATLTMGFAKALTWYFIVQTVCSVLYQETYMMLTRLLDSKLFVAYCNHNRNI